MGHDQATPFQPNMVAIRRPPPEAGEHTEMLPREFGPDDAAVAAAGEAGTTFQMRGDDLASGTSS